jgi:hypothetical protein
MRTLMISLLTGLFLIGSVSAQAIPALSTEPVAPTAPTLNGPELLAPPLLPVPEDIDPSMVLPESASVAMLDFLASIIRDNIPEKHLEDKDWNQTKRVYAGIKFRREGLRLETERRWKTVNHGLWRKYELKLVDPKRTLIVRLSDVYWQPDGRLHANLNVVCELDVTAWQTRYNFDVRLYSVQVDASIRLVLELETTIGFRLDQTQLPPLLVIDPHVEKASLAMSSFHVDKIGHLGGDLSEELGDASESLIRQKLVEPQSEKLAAKLNRQIDKKRDKLRIDAGEWLSRWFADFRM